MRTNEALLSIEHVAVVSTALGHLIGLINLYLLHPSERALSPRVASSCALRTRHQLLTASRLHVSSRGESVAETRWIKPARSIVHVFVGSEILTSAHELVTSGTPSVVAALCPLFVDDGHLVEVVLCQVEMLPSLILHFLACVEVQRQLLNLKTVFILNFVGHTSMLRLLAPLLLMVVRVRNFRVTLVWRHLRTVDGLLVTHVQCIHILWVLELLLALSGVDDALCLDISFLTRRCSSRGNTLTIGD